MTTRANLAWKPVRLLVPTAATVVAFLCIFAWNTAARPALKSAMHVLASNYFPEPFSDTRAVLAVIECHRMGIDVYVRVPCDVPLQRPHIYSSLWLLASRTEITQAATLAVGTVLTLGFCLSLFLLPSFRTKQAALIGLLAVFSNAVAFAVWQANADVVIFILLAVGAALLLTRLPLRISGYALILLAGALKFYPVIAMATAVRERATSFFAVMSGSLVAFAAFVWLYGHDALRAMSLVPHGWVTQMSGSTVLPTGVQLLPWRLRNVVTAPPMALGGWLLWLVLTIACLGCATALSRSRPFATAVTSRNSRERVFALVGCTIVVACFFVGQSLRYRDVFLLFILPMWANLATEAETRRGRQVFCIGVLSLVLSFWFVWLENVVDHLSNALSVPEQPAGVLIDAIWLARELVRWILVTLVLATAIPLYHQSLTLQRGLGASLLSWFTERQASSGRLFKQT